MNAAPAAQVERSEVAHGAPDAVDAAAAAPPGKRRAAPGPASASESRLAPRIHHLPPLI
jgi:hypothetical protein